MNLQDKKEWYVLFVKANQEEKVKKILEKEEHGVINYSEEKVQCSLHVDEDDSDGDVPYL